jgi:ribosomal subunit interface protein
MLNPDMQVPLSISFRNVPPSPAIEADIREKAAKLEEFCDRITSARVVIETPHRQHRQGKLFHVRIDLRVPGRELVVSREPAAHHAYEDVYVAIRDAFDGAKRQLEDYVREMRGTVKAHEPTPQGRIVRLHPEDGYGFIETADGREVYFHQHSVVDGDFDRLRVGDEVRFSEEPGEQGPQASTVHRAGVPSTRKKRRRART